MTASSISRKSFYLFAADQERKQLTFGAIDGAGQESHAIRSSYQMPAQRMAKPLIRRSSSTPTS
jgi:hypothetical protein